MNNTRHEFNMYLTEPYIIENHPLTFRLMNDKVEDNPSSSCFDKITDWWFPIVNNNDTNPGNLELTCSKICCTEDTRFYCICFSVAFL